MKKKSRRAKSSEASQTPRKQMTPSFREEMKTSRKTLHVTPDSFYHDKAAADKTVDFGFSVAVADEQKQSRSSGKIGLNNPVLVTQDYLHV